MLGLLASVTDLPVIVDLRFVAHLAVENVVGRDAAGCPAVLRIVVWGISWAQGGLVTGSARRVLDKLATPLPV